MSILISHQALFCMDKQDGAYLADISFSEEDIEAACSELKASSAAGADGIPACLLKTCKKELSKPLHILWRSSLAMESYLQTFCWYSSALFTRVGAGAFPRTTGRWPSPAI